MNIYSVSFFIFFSLGFVQASLKAASAKKIVLITNLGKNQGPLSLKLENRFSDSLDGNDQEILIFRNIDPYDLYEIVNSDSVEAIFLVAHMNNLTRGKVRNLKKKGVFLSFNEENDPVDIKPFFYHLNSNIKFVALCGCHSESHLELFKKNDNSEFPMIQTFNGYVDADSGLREAIDYFNGLDQSKFSDRNEIIDTEPVQDKVVHIKATRMMDRVVDDSYYPSIRIMHRNRIIAMFPSGSPGQSQEITFPLVISSLKESDLKFKVDSGIVGILPKQKLGYFIFNCPQIQGNWKRFSNAAGEPFGTSAHIYQFNHLHKGSFLQGS